MKLAILKKTDLAEIRNANMRIVKNKGGDYTPVDIGRASRVMIQLKGLEIKAAGVDENVGVFHRPGRSVSQGDPIVDTFGHLKIVR